MSMIGLVSKLSEAVVALTNSISPKADIVRVTDTTSTTVLTTMVPPYGGFSGKVVVINQSGAAITTLTTGNILTATTIADKTAVCFYYSKSGAKWVVGSTT